MKYRVGVSEKITKDGKDYQVWKVSEQAGFYLADSIAREDAQELIDRIIASCSALAVKLEREEQTDESGTTQPFDTLQKEAEDSVALKNKTRELHEKLPFLVRKRTGEKIAIDKNIFKLGKDAAYVDYFVDDNPTISRNHADIVRKDDGFYAKDKGSLNHTFVDGKKLEPEKPVKLVSGSLLQLADEVFEFLEEV